MNIRQFAITAVLLETLCIVILLVLLVLPKEAIDVMNGQYKLVKVQ